ncbi:MAG: hypothetical protein JWL93_1298 [Hyphomicrobiales bacterium]|nr:hypothetical protein [Hyphomicrobiales bacterium]
MNFMPAGGLSDSRANRIDRSIGGKTWLAFAALAMVQLALIWTHVPWMDELQAVLLARDTHSLADWYWNFRYEGHPPLWHLLLKLPLAMGLDAETSLKLVLTPFVLGVLALIVFKSPFALPWRVFLGLNYFLIFEYGAIARPYTVGVCLLLAAVAYPRRRLSWLAVALLPTCGLQFSLLAIVGGWLLLREKNVWAPGVALLATGVVVALVWIRPEPDFQSALSVEVISDSRWVTFVRTLIRAGSTIFATDWQGHGVQWIRLSEMTVGPLWVAGVALPFLAIASVRPHRLFMLFVAAFVAATYAISTFSFGLSGRHFGLIFILVLALHWVQASGCADRRRNDLFRAWVVVLAIQGGMAAVQNLRYPFSTVREVARWIELSGERATLFVPLGVGSGSEITNATGLPTLDLAQSCLQTFTRTRAPSYFALLQAAVGRDQLQDREAASFVLEDLRRAAARAGGRALVLLDVNQNMMMQQVAGPDFWLRAIIPNGRPGGVFDRWIYEMRATPADPPQPFPDCGQLVAR